MITCVRKMKERELFITVGEDKYLRVWNFITKELVEEKLAHE